MMWIITSGSCMAYAEQWPVIRSKNGRRQRHLKKWGQFLLIDMC